MATLTRTRQVLSVSLPREMVSEIAQVSRFEHRTQSETIREAVRKYLATQKKGISVDVPSVSDLSAIRRANKEIKKGDYISLDELLA